MKFHDLSISALRFAQSRHELSWIAKDLLRQGGTHAWEPQVWARKGCGHMSWSVGMVKGNRSALRTFLWDWDWGSLLLQATFPVFFAVLGAAEVCTSDGCLRAAARAAMWEGKIRTLFGEVHEWWAELGDVGHLDVSELAASRRASGQRRPHARHIIGHLNAFRPALRATASRIQRWAQKEPHWLNAGGDQGLWSTLHAFQAVLQNSPPCVGFPAGTNHLGPLAHTLCFAQSGAVQAAVFGHGYWAEADVIAHLFLFAAVQLDFSPQQCRVIDVGANVGSVALLLAKLGFAVEAVEADPVNVQGLWQGIWRMRLSAAGFPSGPPGPAAAATQCAVVPGRVTAYTMAASDRRGTLTIGPSQSQDTATSTVRWNGSGAGDEDREVGAETLDRVFCGRGAPCGGVRQPPVGMLKLDVEGSEWRALLGAQQVLATVHVIALEVFPTKLQRSGCSSPALLAAALPGFDHQYILRHDFSVRRNTRVRLYRLRHCLSLRSWEDWGRCATSSMAENLLLARRPFHGSSIQSLRAGEPVMVEVMAEDWAPHLDVL